MGSSVKRKTRTQYNIRMAKDSHISLAVVFDVPEGQDASPYKAKFCAKSKAGTKECLYYGFGTLGNKVMCREGYKSAAGFLAHVNEIKDELEGLIKQVGKERVKILCSGTKGDLENIKSHMDGRLTIKYLELDSGALMLNPLPSGCADTHITILPEFVVPDGRMDEFKAGFEKFYNATKNGSEAWSGHQRAGPGTTEGCWSRRSQDQCGWTSCRAGEAEAKAGRKRSSFLGT